MLRDSLYKLVQFYMTYISVCGPCCREDREIVSFTSVVAYSPEIILDEPLHPNDIHSPSDLRPTSTGEGVRYEIAYSPDPFASATIDLDVPGVENSALDVETIHLEGNVQTVTVEYMVDDNGNSWTTIDNVNVGDDGVVEWPTGGEYVTIGKLKLTPLTATSLDDEDYLMKVDIIGCGEAYSKSAKRNSIYVIIN